MLKNFSAQIVVWFFSVLTVSFAAIAAKQQEPCMFPAKYAPQIAGYLNTKGGWPAHSKGRDQDYELAPKNVADFLDAKYQYCQQMLGK